MTQAKLILNPCEGCGKEAGEYKGVRLRMCLECASTAPDVLRVKAKVKGSHE